MNHTEVEKQLDQFGVRVAWTADIDEGVVYFPRRRLAVISQILDPSDAIELALRLWTRQGRDPSHPAA